MTIPEWILLGFAGWTIITLLVGVGIHRWSRILTGRTEMKDFRADGAGGTDFFHVAGVAVHGAEDGVKSWLAFKL